MALSRREKEDLTIMVEQTVQKCMGFSDSSIVLTAINCYEKGYERKKTSEKFVKILDPSQASKLVENLFNTYDTFKSGTKLKNRKRKEESRFDENVESKKTKVESEIPVPEPGQPSPGQLTADKIKEMMANAQKAIQERKRELFGDSLPPPPPPEVVEKERRANDLKASIQARLQGLSLPASSQLPLAQFKQDQLQPSPQVAQGPTPLILDDQGRTIDAKTGQTITLPNHMPTLKANIRAIRREKFKAAVQEKPTEEVTDGKFFDSRVSMKPAQRVRRGFKFHEEGKFQQLASRLRTKAQLEKLQNEIASAAKKTGIASAAKLAIIQPKKELRADEIPVVEWWDALMLPEDSYDTEIKPTDLKGITNLVEHPTQMKAPSEPNKDVEIAVILTKKERKKLRRQMRNETQKELTEKIRLGLMPPPEPKVRMANLMRVLGNEAVQDPTKVEQHVREQMAKRQRQHEQANAERKLTKEQRRDKKIKKIKEDVSLGVQVAVYRVGDLKDPSKKYKVEMNAKQLYMTGIVVLYRDCNVVVVEGGPKQQKKFRRLMLHRIKWKGKDDEDSDDEDKKANTCVLVWTGEVKNRAFREMQFKLCPTEAMAREQFKKCGVEQYWDLSYSGAVLEAAGEDLT